MHASGVYSPVHRTSDIRAEDFGHRHWEYYTILADLDTPDGQPGATFR